MKEKGLNYVNFTINLVAVIIICITLHFALQRLQLSTINTYITSNLEIAEGYVLTTNADESVDGKTKREDRYHIILAPSAYAKSNTLSSTEKEEARAVANAYIAQIKELFDLDSSFVPQSGDLKNLNCSRVEIKKLIIYEALYSNEAVGCKHISDTVVGFQRYEVTFVDNAVRRFSKKYYSGSSVYADEYGVYSSTASKKNKITSSTIIVNAEFDINVFYKGFGEGITSSPAINEEDVTSVSDGISTKYTIKENAWMTIWGKEAN